MTANQQAQKASILSKTVDLLRLRRMALSTERTYIQWIGSYIDWLSSHGGSLPDSRARVEAYLTALAYRGCAASTQNQAFNALLFLYTQVRREKLPEINALRAKQPRHHRTAISKPQTLALLDAVPDVSGYPTHFIARLLYGCGLRVISPLA